METYPSLTRGQNGEQRHAVTRLPARATSALHTRTAHRGDAERRHDSSAARDRQAFFRQFIQDGKLIAAQV